MKKYFTKFLPINDNNTSLFLCSRDIKEEDEFYSSDGIKHKCRNVFNWLNNPIEDDDGLCHSLEKVYKIIGEIEISSDTIIEEYTEYDVDEFYFQCKYCMLSGETDFNHRMGCENKSKESLIIKIK